MKNIRQHVFRGLGWTAGGQITQQALHMGVSVVLARLLTPRDFGLLGMMLVLTGFAGLFMDMGFGAALVQKADPDERHCSSVFWLNLMVGVALAGIVLALAPLLASVCGEPILRPMTMAVAVNMLIGSGAVVQNALLMRSMDFRRLFWIGCSGTVVGGCGAIAMAACGMGAWSLVGQSLLTTTTTLLVLWGTSSWRPRLLFDRSAIRELLRFSGHLLGFDVFNYWCRQADKALIGKVLGMAPLGLYTRAYSLMLLPISNFGQVARKVMFPALCRIQDDVPKVKQVYLRSTRTIALVAFPSLMGLWVLARPVIRMLYGPAWLDVVPIFQVLCIEGISQSVGHTVGWIYTSMGRTDLFLKWGMFAGVVRVISFCVGLQWGVLGVAWSYVIFGYAILWYPAWAVPGRLIGMSFMDMVRNLAPCFGVSLAMSAGVAAVGVMLPNGLAPWIRLAIQVPLGALIYWLLASRFRLKAYLDLRLLLADRMAALAGKFGAGGAGASPGSADAEAGDTNARGAPPGGART